REELGLINTRLCDYPRCPPQQVPPAAQLVGARQGIVSAGEVMGHDRQTLLGSIRFVRAAVPDLKSALWSEVPPAQSAWMREYNKQLETIAADLGIGRSRVLGSVPLEPVLQLREQLITDRDVFDRGIANVETWQAMGELAERLADDKYWGQL
ncbi:ParA family protein, partial [Streptomyces sp. NPDC059378]